MFLLSQPKELQEEYFKLLKIMGALSKIYSESSIPYLYYRGHENAFCRALKADNLSRSDFSADAGKDGIGIGLKTFQNKGGSSPQKIAEFNKNRQSFRKYEEKPDVIVKIISEMRNKRIETTKAVFGLENIIYHCVSRSEKQFFIFEEKMDTINVQNIEILKSNQKGVSFKDNENEYRFDFSKSTLYKKFLTINPIVIDVVVFDDPFSILEKLFNGEITKIEQKKEFVILPLYSMRGGKNVPEKSGLNQWNAGGRERKNREVYIPIPLWIHRKFQGFFPSNEVSFNLHLPNKKILSASICQQGGKALMSNPNTDLGKWLIDDVLKIKENKIVDYDDLATIGVDSVSITKIDNENYEINFKSVGSFERFQEKNTTD